MRQRVCFRDKASKYMDIAIAPPWPTKITYHGLTVMAEVASENISETFFGRGIL
jgi:hypothetical protein